MGDWLVNTRTGSLVTACGITAVFCALWGLGLVVGGPLETATDVARYLLVPNIGFFLMKAIISPRIEWSDD